MVRPVSMLVPLLALLCVAQGFVSQPLCLGQHKDSTSNLANRSTHRSVRQRSGITMAVQDPEHDLLLRAARGEKTDRPPVWLMRQAGRYMAAFREYSEKYGFRQRSETPEIAVELSLQPWKAFGVDGVIMFSDILTPLPAMGVEFDVIRGKGPVIPSPLRTTADINAVRVLKSSDYINDKLPFVGKTLRTLRAQTAGKTTLIGFVGSPWTLAAYSIEGGGSKLCLDTKKMMMEEPALFHTLMTKLADSIGNYACYQIENGAQVIQFFESWAHQMTPLQFEIFARPYANRAMAYVKSQHPEVPVLYFANGGSGYLESQAGMACDMLSLDQFVDMTVARRRLGANTPISGNVDPQLLLGPDAGIKSAVADCIRKGRGTAHVLNLGHGVLQQTPERSVGVLVDAVKSAALVAA